MNAEDEWHTPVAVFTWMLLTGTLFVLVLHNERWLVAWFVWLGGWLVAASLKETS